MKKCFLCIFGCCLLLMLWGCTAAEGQNPEDGLLYIYHVNAEESKIEPEEYQPEDMDTQQLIKVLCEKLSQEPENPQCLSLLPAGVEVESWELEDGELWINFNKRYSKIESPREILMRAGVVRIFCQLDGVEAVGIEVEGQEITDSNNEPVGLMSEESFIENSGKEVNAYQYVTMNLYFTNKSGNKLVHEQRKIYYSKNTPLERGVVEQLLKGPQNSGHYAVIPSEMKILGVSVLDGIGYVNLDNSFVDMALPIQENIAIQAIVTSLAETCNVERVQISINGESKIEFRENISLDQLFEPDESLKKEENND